VQEKKKKGSKCVVQVKDNLCIISDITTGKPKQFAFDYCYWSVNNDGFKSQEDVFGDLGIFYVDNAFKGFNSSVFAYGQTGSGKTYTMLGTAKHPGLIPRGCEELFRRVEQDYANADTQIEIEASYLEVYMDKIFDLLAAPDPKKRKRKTSKIAYSFSSKKRNIC